MDARHSVPRSTVGQRWCILAAACAALSGCAGFWDDVTSRDFKFKEMFRPPPDPLWVIRNTNNGDKRCKAIRALREPLQNGGTQQDQDTIVQVLTWCAVSDPQPLCRMAAIDVLQHFKDPRAEKALEDAYVNAAYFSRDQPEIMAVIHCQALAALGVNANPAAIPLLIGVVKMSPTAADNTNQQQQQNMDERIAAARALGNFRQYQAAEALTAVLRGEQQDVALRNRAAESLRQMTGKDLPADAQAWEDFLHKSGKDALVKQPTLVDKILQLMSFHP